MVKEPLNTEPDGRVGRAGAPRSKGHRFNPSLGPILINSKTFRVFIQIFVTDDHEPSYKLRVWTLDCSAL